ncbi:MAG: FAD-binding oxidoreductase [Gammaproteobacteria bacterium]|nr:FAD-binding oxidoreductase [Gammaproteobacteria bacterium]
MKTDVFWWRGFTPLSDQPLESDLEVDFLVVGAGFTGLNAALTLREHGSVAVVDTVAPGFGASGRNGGFCCVGGVGYDPASARQKYGEAVGQSIQQYLFDAIDHVDGLIAHESSIKHSNDGERMMVMSAIEHRHYQQAALVPPYRYIDAVHLKDQGYRLNGVLGVLHLDKGFAIQPYAYVRHLYQRCLDAGVDCYYPETIEHLTSLANHGVQAELSSGRKVKARKVLLACNGYGELSALKGRRIPVLSNIIATQPIDDSRWQSQGWTQCNMVYDDRHLLHYFRRLPDGRLLFGGRGGLIDTSRGLALRAARLQRFAKQYFPDLGDIEIDTAWGGWVTLRPNLNPYLGPLDAEGHLWCSMGYHGNGVAAGSYSGHQVAKAMLALPNQIPSPFKQHGPKLPLPRLRPVYLSGIYAALHAIDWWQHR